MHEEQVPVIDIRRLTDDKSALARLDAACREWGFFQIVGHGIDDELLAALLTQMKTFFALPIEEKRAIERTATNAWGFYDKELTKNTPDWKEVFDVGPVIDDGPLAGTVPQWPDELPAFKDTLLAFSSACERVAYGLLSAISLNLGAGARDLFSAFGPRHTSFLRLNYYPVCGEPAPSDTAMLPDAGYLGVNHHTDSGALTVLLQDDKPGLQVHREGRWYLVEPRADALVVNIGDVVQVWSNDLYPAPLHRALASAEHARYSAPYFFNPAYETDYAPLPSMCSDIRRPRYRPINWGEFRASRALGDYADYGEEIQIDQFRIRSA